MSRAPTQIAIAVVERDGQFLVGERPKGKPLAGYAEFPGGRVELGETSEQAAVRECLEETGIEVTLIGSYDDRLHDYAHDRLHLHFFACRPMDAAQQPRHPFRWVARAELRRLSFPAANRRLLDILVGDGSSEDSQGG